MPAKKIAFYERIGVSEIGLAGFEIAETRMVDRKKIFHDAKVVKFGVIRKCVNSIFVVCFPS